MRGALVHVALVAALAVTAGRASAQSSPDERYAQARECAIAGDHACVIRALRGHCHSARAFELLLSSLRAVGGYDREIEVLSWRYCARFGCGSVPPRPRYL